VQKELHIVVRSRGALLSLDNVAEKLKAPEKSFFLLKFIDFIIAWALFVTVDLSSVLLKPDFVQTNIVHIACR